MLAFVVVLFFMVGATVRLYSNSLTAVEKNESKLTLLSRIREDRARLLPLIQSATSYRLQSETRVVLEVSRDWLELGETGPLELVFFQKHLVLRGGDKDSQWSGELEGVRFSSPTVGLLEAELTYATAAEPFVSRCVFPVVLDGE